MSVNISTWNSYLSTRRPSVNEVILFWKTLPGDLNKYLLNVYAIFILQLTSMQ